LKTQDPEKNMHVPAHCSSSLSCLWQAAAVTRAPRHTAQLLQFQELRHNAAGNLKLELPQTDAIQN
jgi:hypothetical protein